ncbi:hypothetical protein MYX82_11825 [Acidobacteria bacterium AH-259-D05]|nr:hypothetical protein [Acidobacteria bacterium AH-259-D05]
MARSYTVAEALEAISQRLKVKKTTKFGLVKAKEQENLVNLEIMLKALDRSGPGSVNKISKIRQAITRIEEQEEAESELRRQSKRLQKLVKKIDAEWPRLRGFFRKTGVLYQIHRNRIKAEIYERKEQERILLLLLKLYEKYYKEAARFIRLD